MPKHVYGYKRDHVDKRDFKYRRVWYSGWPKAIDLRGLSSPVRDQGNLGSCVGFSMSTGMREFLSISNHMPLNILSPLYLYYHARLLEGTVNEDSGAELRDGMKVLLDKGCATEANWPYIISKFATKPSGPAEESATYFKISSYHRIESLEDAQACLSNGSGFTIGFYVYESFDTDEVATTGKMPMPKPGEQILGGHAVFVVGYQDDVTWPGGGYLIVKNSWGSDWGDKGYFYMPYAFYTPDYVPDAWVAIVTDIAPSFSASASPSPSPSEPPEPTGCLPAVAKLVSDIRNWWSV